MHFLMYAFELIMSKQTWKITSLVNDWKSESKVIFYSVHFLKSIITTYLKDIPGDNSDYYAHK